MTRPTVLITGASSGIGASFARAFAEKHHSLLLTGRRKDRLENVARRCREQGAEKVETIIAEFTDEKQVRKLAGRIQSQGIDTLINNAGFGHVESFIEDTIENQLSMLDVHVRASVMLTHAALPGMLSNKQGTIINVSSLAALVHTAGSAMYCSTKAFLNAFTKVLHLEHKRNGIRVQALCPGFTHTDFHEKLGIPRERQRNKGALLWMKPDDIVHESLQCLDRGRVVCIPGRYYRVIYRLTSLMPYPLYYRVMSRMPVTKLREL